MIIDLHLHSWFSSDGEAGIDELLSFFSPGDIAGLADHETIAGWPEFKKKAMTNSIIPVLGVEWFSPACHILTYFLRPPPDDFLNFINERRELERQCMKAVFEDIKKQTADFPPYEEVLASRPHPERILGLPALAQAWADVTGKPLTEGEDLIRKLKRRIPETERPLPFFAREIIEKAISWKACPILAHPFRNFGGRPGRRNRKDVENLIRELKPLGLAGLEVVSPGAGPGETEYLLRLAQTLGLVPTAGSDYHSAGKGLFPPSLDGTDPNLKTNIERWLKGSHGQRNSGSAQ